MSVLIIHSVIFLAAIIAFTYVSRIVPLPYLDEIFHIPQTQMYCVASDIPAWNLLDLLISVPWNDKITTPPGLYLLGNIYARLVGDCGVTVLRSLNFVALHAVTPWIVGRDISILAFPLLAFFSTLFYTDLWATVAVLAGLKVGLSGHSVISALILASSLGFRQTNIVWAGYIAVVLLQEEYVKTKSENDPPNFFEDIIGLMKTAIVNPLITLPFVGVAALFGYFLYWNGGIALGDKSNHEVSLNFIQLFHFILHITIFYFPPVALSIFHTYLTRFRSIKIRLLPVLIFFVTSCLVSVCVSVLLNRMEMKAHPFLLADNRHYTFYIWRRFYIPSNENFMFALIISGPLLLLGLLVFTTPLNLSIITDQRISIPIEQIFFVIAICATLIPSPLLEPRYYLIPILIWRLRYFKEFSYSKGLILYETLWFTLINALTFYVFLEKPFEWESEPGSLQRFMW